MSQYDLSYTKKFAGPIDKILSVHIFTGPIHKISSVPIFIYLSTASKDIVIVYRFKNSESNAMLRNKVIVH
jgi:hypothetical protein